eukprot:scaffold4876_cov148-Isochrysis_galbana.AAC.3
MRFNQYQCEHPIIQLAPNPSSVAWASGSVGPKPGPMGPIGQNEFPLGSPKMDTDGSVPTPLPSSKSGRPPPTLAKFRSSGPPTGLGGVKTLECEQLKSTAVLGLFRVLIVATHDASHGLYYLSPPLGTTPNRGVQISELSARPSLE